VGDDDPHVYVSVGHQQMMTDPMKPLGLSVWQLTAARPMHVAAGRLFVDVGANLASPTAREAVIAALGRSDPLIGSALQAIVDRGDVVPERPDPDPADAPPGPPAMGLPPEEPDPALVAELIAEREASLADLAIRLDATDGPAVFDVIAEDLRGYQQLFDPRSIRVIMTAIEASWWLDEQLEGWLGERGAADVLTRSAPGNVTSEMGLALLDVADVIRPHEEVVAYLRSASGDDGFVDRLDGLGPAGVEVRDALERFLDTYGMRCVGEIDITRPRWRERPSMLLPVLLGNVDHAEPGAGGQRFEQGRAEAEAKAAEVLERLRALPDGEAKAAEAAANIDRVRTFIGFREYPKYALVRRYFLYKQALLREVARLLDDGVLREEDDAWFLTFAELGDAARTGHVDLGLVDERRRAFDTYASLTPPRVMTGDGEVVTGRYGRSDVPRGALVGLAVSAGTVEGRARVVHDVAGADLRPGDILVTTHTDPSWSPVFASIAGLVTEVGGVITHGAVVAREYGLPAVVGVVDATRLIRDGQRIRVHGIDGHVELLDEV
ncbi:MAG: phosphoenolpyruvate synthase, partial [Actinobacteria bacterium]|nr:phosphoenolpyruvate synthase [Actinomycetota bacterium]